jgi:hypothetical protein
MKDTLLKIVNGDWEGHEMVGVYFKVIRMHLFREFGKNHEKRRNKSGPRQEIELVAIRM